MLNQTAVLLINLGTPEAPTPKAVKKYLKEFLSDRRVISISPWLWQPLLRGVILPLRSRSSAKKYQSIWSAQGSPLKFYTEQQTLKLREKLSALGYPELRVDFAMRYGLPGLPETLSALSAEGFRHILLLPLYPQYAGSSTGSALEASFQAIAAQQHPPGLQTITEYFDEPAYIDAMKIQINAHWAQHGKPHFEAGDRLLLSFHGLPQRVIDHGDPYYSHCVKTYELLREALGLDTRHCLLSFQSRFGKEKWLEPATAPLLKKLGQDKTQRVDVFCPGFVADCLETIEELGIEGRAEFLSSGGKQYHLISCLNDAPAWIDALASLILTSLLERRK